MVSDVVALKIVRPDLLGAIASPPLFLAGALLGAPLGHSLLKEQPRAKHLQGTLAILELRGRGDAAHTHACRQMNRADCLVRRIHALASWPRRLLAHLQHNLTWGECEICF